MPTTLVPPSATAGQATGSDLVRSRLPVELTRFIGRSREVATVRQLLGTTRLLTLTGAGGSGKTRLALEVAMQVGQEHADDVAWAELAALADPELLPQQIATALGIRETAGRPATEILLDVLRERSLVLVLDNCEHLADACARLAERLVRGCPGLRVLATSREALGVAGEQAWLVPPLSSPDTVTSAVPEQLAGFEAVQLFVARAQDVLPDFALTEHNAAAVAQICRRLDGMPLAIELAAARVRVLAPDQIAQRLDDAFALLTSGSRTALPRHRTLRATIDWSYQLLSAAEQLLLQRLSAFAGGFTLEAVEAVCADEHLEAWEVLDVLARLVDRSLVMVSERGGAARYHLLETVRQFAEQQLRERDSGGGDAAHADCQLPRRHALHYLTLAESADEQLHQPRQLEALAVLDVEHDNLRAALACSFMETNAELALRLCAALREFWRMRGHLSEGRRWMREALSLPATAGALRALVLVGAANLARLQGDHAMVREHLAEAEAIARRVGDRDALAHALTSLGLDLVLQRDLSGARERLDEAIGLHRELGGSWGLTLALGGRAAVALAEDDPALARALRVEAAEVSRRAGDREGEARALLGLGELARQQDDHPGAGAYYERSLALLRELGDPYHIGVALHNLAWVAIAAGRFDEALQLLAEDMDLETIVGNQVGPAFTLGGFAPILHARGHAGTAALALAAAQRHLAQAGINPPPAETREWERVRLKLRSTLGEERFEQAWSAGLAENVSTLVTRVVEMLGGGVPEPRSASAQPAPVEPLPSAAVPHSDSMPAAAAPALRVLALGALEVRVEGELLPTEVWRYARPKELLLFLLCHPQGRTREQIGLHFWPEASPAQVKNNFHVTLHHLRKALGRSDLVAFADERYRINPELRVEFDALLFEERITAALRQLRTADGAVAPERLASLLALYRGDFAEHEALGDWHLELRDHLARLYLDGMLALGELLMQQARWTEAAEVYQRIVRKEDLHEEAHRRLMRCWAEAGERTRALRHYEGLVSLLQAELDAEPEDETTELYERLKRAEPV